MKKQNMDLQYCYPIPGNVTFQDVYPSSKVFPNNHIKHEILTNGIIPVVQQLIMRLTQSDEVYSERKLHISMRVKVSPPKFFDVVVVGNGPAGICLSYMLSGNWPYYNGEVIQDPTLHERSEMFSTEVSLVEQDLDPLIDGLYDARSKNPVSILFDKLHHPNADFMTEEPSVLTWKNNENSSFKHIVLGNGPPGGTWHRMSYSQYSLSLDYWLELPGYQFKQWQEEHNYKNEMSGCSCNLPKLTRGEGVHESRILPNHVAQYYSDYVKRMKLDSNFMNNVTVTSVKRMSPNNPIWTVCGVQYNTASGENEQLQFFARNVVLAVGGYSIPRMLNIPGEDEKFVRYQLPDLDDFLQEVDVKRMAPVVVVGCGLVALDAIIALMERRVPVFHVFRREAKDPKLIVNQLPSSYPDYLKLKPLMAGKSSNEYYTPFQQSRITEILPSNECTIEHVSGKSRVMVKTSQIVVQIGSKPNLSIMGEMRRLGEDSSREVDIKENPVDIDPFTYESTEAGLYAIGPLVGDNFVRFILGGALAIVSGLVQKNKPKSE